jgi:hypothetical protein
MYIIHWFLDELSEVLYGTVSDSRTSGPSEDL